MNRVRKAMMAGATAALAILGTQLAKDGVPANPDGWAALVVALAGAFAVAAFATYQVRNDATVNGSDPVPPTYGRPVV